MGKRLYVGNLAYSLKSQDLEEVFRSAGEVVHVKVVTDQETGRSKGFAFVEMGSDDQAAAAIETLNGKDVGGRALKVTEANPRPERPAGGGFRGSRDRVHGEGGPSRGGGFGGSGGDGNRNRGGDRNDGNRW